MEINYENIIQLLKLESDKIIEKLRVNNTSELVNEKKNIENGIKWLKKGMENQIDPNLNIITIPEQITKTPSSEFRLIEDHESDDKKNWTIVKLNNVELRPISGDFLIMK
ncbi:hypothetical protein [Flavobacterium sp.]|uniref:hypothetical protein n=1 Tax=Flavobacterium sp. TaxID=239 RepID=UPI00404867A7